jgi:FKBP-type peptidyl-prolyl cis-trans isomerase FkpA
MTRLVSILVVCVVAAACGGGGGGGPTVGPTTSAPYSQNDLVVGTGTSAAPGNLVTVAYTGWLHDAGRPDQKGSQFDSSSNFTFRLGVGAVIRGWDMGVVGMNVGGRRRLVIPPELAYGNQSPGSGIPPNATLVFEVALNAVQ